MWVNFERMAGSSSTNSTFSGIDLLELRTALLPARQRVFQSDPLQILQIRRFDRTVRVAAALDAMGDHVGGVYRGQDREPGLAARGRPMVPRGRGDHRLRQAPQA